MKINWIQKLTSRKLWTALTGFVAGLLVYFGKSAEETDSIVALIMAFASLLAYIIAEGLVDANRVPEETINIKEPPDSQP